MTPASDSAVQPMEDATREPTSDSRASTNSTLCCIGAVPGWGWCGVTLGACSGAAGERATSATAVWMSWESRPLCPPALIALMSVAWRERSSSCTAWCTPPVRLATAHLKERATLGCYSLP